jgi:hypothetical protein
MDYFSLFVESVGVISTGFYLYSSVLTDDKKLSFYYTIGCLFLASHLLLINAWVAGSSVLLSALRNILVRYDRKGYIKLMFMFIFVGIFAYYFVNHKHWSELLVPFSSVVMSYAFLYTKGNILTLCMFVSAGLWLIFSLYVESYSVLILEISTITLLFVRVIKQNNVLKSFKLKFSKTTL